MICLTAKNMIADGGDDRAAEDPFAGRGFGVVVVDRAAGRV